MRPSAIATALALVFVAGGARAAEDGAKPAGPAYEREREPEDAPPPAPYAKGLVVDASIGAIGFLGQFGKLAPPGPWFHGQIGYELLEWLMLYGETELAFTTTGNKEEAPRTRVFSLFGFGGGARLTWRITERIGIYGQPGVGAMTARIARNALGLHGFNDAEELSPWVGFRAGFEWFQIDRHLALGLNSGVRFATGFAKSGRSSDTPLALDGGISLRYAF
ncbi:MAG: hypothetical protein KIT84_02700 [Labilithrix sp.]|nr:hypothetical protein [Labilithrix sp.]MCW5809890.1 hypothetical protein [Labilithrix sp.]